MKRRIFPIIGRIMMGMGMAVIAAGCSKKAEEPPPAPPVTTLQPGAVKPGPPLRTPADAPIPGQYPPGVRPGSMPR
jgi:hypothetical protein